MAFKMAWLQSNELIEDSADFTTFKGHVLFYAIITPY